MSEKRRSIQNLLPWFIVALGAALRIPVLLHPHLGMEDLYSIGLRGESFKALIKSAGTSGQAPFFNLFFANWARISENRMWLAAPSIIMSIVTIYALYRICTVLIGRTAGLWAAYTCAISPFAIYYSGRIRYENFTILAALGTIYYAFKIIEKKGSLRDVLLYGVFAALGVYNLYYALYIIGALNLYFLLKRKGAAMWLSAQVVTLLLLLPWVPIFIQQFNARTGEWRSLLDVFRDMFGSVLFNILDVVICFYSGIHIGIHDDDYISKSILIMSLLVIAAVGAGVIKTVMGKGTKRRTAVLYGLFIQFGCFFIMLFMNLWKQTPLMVKYAVGFAPIQYCLTGAAMVTVRKNAAICFFVLLTVLSVTSLSQYYPVIMKLPGTESIMNYIQEQEREGDHILVYSSFYEHELAYYYRGKLEISGFPENHDMINNTYGAGTKTEYYPELLKKYSYGSRIWLLLPSEGSFSSEEAALIIHELEILGFRVVVRKEYRTTTIPECTGVMMLFESDN